MMNKKNRGFSLVELIVVVAIMAVLVGVLAPSLLRYVEKTRAQKDASAVAEVIEAVKVACADETVATSVSATVTVVVANGSITGGTSEMLADVVKTTPAASVKLTSNAHKSQHYDIVVTYSADGLSVAEYDAAKWAD